ncbi:MULTISPECIES: uracil-DNA glycosylase family protein [Paenibacillus]|uniref:uracil-DNA glycosylase family protein n=1 Tax=Paenibacillus TaxID=44249 RepID=UPI0020C97F8A|nr:uracil-DNA glycosylase family protein [Paenibacillus odorifer]
MLTKQDLQVDKLLMERNGKVEMYYAPHNEYINPSAKVIIIGLTPGFTQMGIAIQEAIISLEAGLSDEEVCRTAKEAARFAGSMRNTLIHMLDTLKLHQHLNLTSCEELFQQQTILHTSSLLRFPVFVDKKNYSGAQPKLLSNSFLRAQALSSLREELNILSRALIIPLGKTVESILQLLVSAGELDKQRCLWGFPHPSGANGHRYKQFASQQEQMVKILHNHSWKG